MQINTWFRARAKSLFTGCLWFRVVTVGYTVFLDRGLTDKCQAKFLQL